jgi:hypothetical protein
MSEECKPSENVKEKILLRNNWLKIFVVIVFTCLITYKLLTSSFSIDMSKFDFNAFLSLILAFFSIGLSVVFFFKASDTSTLFYDNTYKFTKDMSTMLGRIEAGFGERLKHLDEGYVGLRDRFDKMPFNREKAEEQIKSNTEEMEKALQERNKVIEDLAEKAKLSQKQKDELLKNLSEKETNLVSMQQELFFLKKRLENNKRKLIVEEFEEVPRPFINYIKSRIIEILQKNSINPRTISYQSFKRKFSMIESEIDQSFIRDSIEYGLFTEERVPTEKFYIILTKLYKTMF